MSSLKLAMIVTAALAASACDRDRGTNEAMQPELPAGEAAAVSQNAVDAITSARCEREARCKNIGTDEDYPSMAACKSQIQSEWKDELNGMECGAGVVQKELDECLEEIRNENCANPFDTLGRLGACRSNDICEELAAR